MEFCNRTISINNRNYAYEKPKKCPMCDVTIEAIPATPMIGKYGKDSKIVFIPMQCPACSQTFISVYEWQNEHNKLDFIQVIPLSKPMPVPEILQQISPRGAKVTLDARRADAMGMIDLASIGYRTAVELFVKDYAVSVLQVNADEVENKKLAQAISDYLKGDAFNTGDVVRILGTDYAHYTPKNEEVPFEELRYYFDAFVEILTGCCKIKKPIVTRVFK